MPTDLCSSIMSAITSSSAWDFSTRDDPCCPLLVIPVVAQDLLTGLFTAVPTNVTNLHVPNRVFL